MPDADVAKMNFDFKLQGDYIPDEKEAAEIAALIVDVKKMGFDTKFVVVSKIASSKLICSRRPETDLAKGRIALQEAGFDITDYRKDNAIDWQISKRTVPGTGWGQ